VIGLTFAHFADLSVIQLHLNSAFKKMPTKYRQVVGSAPRATNLASPFLLGVVQYAIDHHNTALPYAALVDFASDVSAASPFQKLQRDLAAAAVAEPFSAPHVETAMDIMTGKVPTLGMSFLFALDISHGGTLSPLPSRLLERERRTNSPMYIRLVVENMFPTWTQEQVAEFVYAGSTPSGHVFDALAYVAAQSPECFDYLRSSMFVHFNAQYFTEVVVNKRADLQYRFQRDWISMFRSRYSASTCLSEFDLDSVFYALLRDHPTANYGGVTGMADYLLRDVEFQAASLDLRAKGHAGIALMQSLVSVHKATLTDIVRNAADLSSATFYMHNLDMDGPASSGWPAHEERLGTQGYLLAGTTGTGKTSCIVDIINDLLGIGKRSVVNTRALRPGDIGFVFVVNTSERTAIAALLRKALGDEVCVVTWSEFSGAGAPGQSRMDTLITAAGGKPMIVVSCYAGEIPTFLLYGRVSEWAFRRCRGLALPQCYRRAHSSRRGRLCSAWCCCSGWARVGTCRCAAA
jgi:hypothetical protein